MTQPAISRDAELHLLLQEERGRCNKFKELYQICKDEHSKLKDELELIHQQLQDSISKNKEIQTSKDEKIRILEKQLHDKQRDILQLSEEVKSYDAQKIRDSVLEEATNHYESKLKKLHSEIDRAREQYNNLHYECTVLKCKFESREKEYSYALDRLKIQHLEEVHHLQNKIEVFDKQKSASNDPNVDELKSAKYEILQLNTKLKAFLAECEELRAKNENLTLQLNSTNKTHLKQMSDNVANIRMLESEKQKVVMRKESLEKEIDNVYEQRKVMVQDLQASKKEIHSLKNKLEDSEHKSNKMITDLQVENGHLKAEHESDIQYLLSEQLTLKAILKDTVAELEQLRQTSALQKQELQQNLIAIRQQLWRKSTEFDQEKERMEKKFLDFQNTKNQVISNLTHEVEILQQSLSQCTEAKLELEKQILTFREHPETSRKNSDGNPRIEADNMLSKENLHLENQIKDLKDEINVLKASSDLFSGGKDKLVLDLLTKQKTDHTSDEQKEILELKLSWEQQKYQFYQRIEALESQLKDSKNVFSSDKKELDQKIQHYSKIVNKLKEKLEFHKVKNEDLENQKEILKNNVPYEVHQQVMKKLVELQRRLEEYRFIVAAEPHFPISSQIPTSMPDKLLTDVKNLQLHFPSCEDYRLPRTLVEEKKPDRQSHRKRSIFSQRRSVKSRHRDQNSRVGSNSQALTSSSDIDLENL